MIKIQNNKNNNCHKNVQAADISHCHKNDQACIRNFHVNKLKHKTQSNLHKKNNNIKIGFPVNLGCI